MAFYVGRGARFSFRRGALLPPADGARQIRRYFESRGISSEASGRPEPDCVEFARASSTPNKGVSGLGQN
jgi:hypothetical protein